MNDIMEPVVTQEDIFSGREFQETPPGTYRMTVHKNIKIRKTNDGSKKKLVLFFIHADPDNKQVYKGVNGDVMLSGTDKNGKPLRRQFAQFLLACKVPQDKLFADGHMRNEVEVIEMDDLDAADWKGVAAQIRIDGEPLDLEGVELTVKVAPNTYQGKTKMRADAFYPAS